MYYTKLLSPIGLLTLVSDGNNLIGLWMEYQKYVDTKRQEQMIRRDDLDIFKITSKWLDEYFDGKKPDVNVIPLNPSGTKFQKLVWRLLFQIPYGEITTYGSIARQIEACLGKKMSAQAVGGAISRNPISIIIPCHRVIGSNGNLTGYAGGINTKKFLLTLENIKINDKLKVIENDRN